MKTFSALLALCEGNSPVTNEFPSQKPAMRIFVQNVSGEIVHILKIKFTILCFGILFNP